jgi:hypothetical protein
MSNPIGTYSVPGFTQSTYSNEYDNIDSLLIQIPDNDQNSIQASDIRDAVYTLWQRTTQNGSSFFQNSNPTPYDVGGIPAGTIFSDPIDMQTIWNNLLYPYVAPSISLGPTFQREYGATQGLLFESITLNWSVIKNSQNITSINIDGQSVTPIITGNSQNGTYRVTGTHSLSPGASQINTFTLTVNDGNQIVSTNTTITWSSKIYWGSIDLGGVNLTINSGALPQVSSLCNDISILSLSGAGVGTGSILAAMNNTRKDKVYNNINGGGRHLIFAWPTSLPDSTNPIFTVNGLSNTAFTRVRTSSPFTNQYGFTTNYEVWVSNTLQNSPLDITIS